jgi:hypothetical protein
MLVKYLSKIENTPLFLIIMKNKNMTLFVNCQQKNVLFYLHRSKSFSHRKRDK